MLNRDLPTLIVLACALALGSCAGLTVERETVQREVDEFSSVFVMGSGHVRIEFGRGYAVFITADEDSQRGVLTQVDDGTLVISRPGWSPIPGGLDVLVRAPFLDSISVQAGASAEVFDVTGPELELLLEGDGRMLLQGEVGHLDAGATGSGMLDATRLRCRTCKAFSAGGAEVAVTVSDRLEAKVTGSGRVTYEKAATGPEFKLEKTGAVVPR